MERDQKKKEQRSTAVSFIKAAINYLELPNGDAYNATEDARVEPDAPLSDLVRSLAVLGLHKDNALAATEAVAAAIRADRIPLSLFLPVVRGGAIISLPYHVAQAIFDAVENGIHRLSPEDALALKKGWEEQQIAKRQCEIYMKMFEDSGWNKPRF